MGTAIFQQISAEHAAMDVSMLKLLVEVVRQGSVAAVARTSHTAELICFMTVEKRQHALLNLNPMLAREIERKVNEGEGHTGVVSVVQSRAQKEA